MHSMTVSKYERFAVRKPIYDARFPSVKGRQAPPMTFLSSQQIPEANFHIEMAWVYAIPEPNPCLPPQVLDHDQLVLFIGMDPETPQGLGATVEFYLGGQSIVLNATSSVFIPKGTPYGPVSWKEVRRPHVQLSMVFGCGDPYPAGRKAVDGTIVELPNKTEKFDYEQYVIRSPMREAGPNYVEGRQNPTMTYLSRTQINAVSHYVEFGWIWGVPNPSMPKMRHDDFDEIVLHIGSDPDNPEALGGTLQFGIGEELLEFDTSHCVYLPKTTDHGPLMWKQVRRPLIELAMMLGAGTLAEGWTNSFFDLPDGSRRGPK